MIGAIVAELMYYIRRGHISLVSCSVSGHPNGCALTPVDNTFTIYPSYNNKRNNSVLKMAFGLVRQISRRVTLTSSVAATGCAFPTCGTATATRTVPTVGTRRTAPKVDAPITNSCAPKDQPAADPSASSASNSATATTIAPIWPTNKSTAVSSPITFHFFLLLSFKFFVDYLTIN